MTISGMILAALAGLEPATSMLEASPSIQLIYKANGILTLSIKPQAQGITLLFPASQLQLS
jgi:hypothetical protein